MAQKISATNLGHKAGHASLDGFVDRPGVRLAGNHENLNVFVGRPNSASQVDATLTGQVHVQQNQVQRLNRHSGQSFRSASRFYDEGGWQYGANSSPQAIPHQRVVVYNQNTFWL